MVIFFIVNLIFWYSLSRLTVTSVICKQSTGDCTPPTLTILEGLRGSSFFFSDHEALARQKNQGSLPFTTLSIQKQLPGTLIITIREEPSLYKLQVGGVLSAVSNSGQLLTVSPSVQAVPTVSTTTIEDATTIKTVPFHQTIVSILNSLPKKYITANTTIEYYSPAEIRLFLPEEPQLIMSDPPPSYALQHIESLLYTVETATQSQKIKEIDLRFNLPVLRTEEEI